MLHLPSVAYKSDSRYQIHSNSNSFGLEWSIQALIYQHKYCTSFVWVCAKCLAWYGVDVPEAYILVHNIQGIQGVADLLLILHILTCWLVVSPSANISLNTQVEGAQSQGAQWFCMHISIHNNHTLSRSSKPAKLTKNQEKFDKIYGFYTFHEKIILDHI